MVTIKLTNYLRIIILPTQPFSVLLHPAMLRPQKWCWLTPIDLMTRLAHTMRKSTSMLTSVHTQPAHSGCNTLVYCITVPTVDALTLTLKLGSVLTTVGTIIKLGRNIPRSDCVCKHSSALTCTLVSLALLRVLSRASTQNEFQWKACVIL